MFAFFLQITCIIKVFLCIFDATQAEPAVLSSSMLSLEQFYNETNGDGWNVSNIRTCLDNFGLKSTGDVWNFKKNPSDNTYISDACSFVGIDCTCTTTICDISMLATPCGSLTGKLSNNTFDNLLELKQLVLYKNSIRESIPSSFFKLSKLETFNAA